MPKNVYARPRVTVVIDQEVNDLLIKLAETKHLPVATLAAQLLAEAIYLLAEEDGLRPKKFSEIIAHPKGLPKASQNLAIRHDRMANSESSFSHDDSPLVELIERISPIKRTEAGAAAVQLYMSTEEKEQFKQLCESKGWDIGHTLRCLAIKLMQEEQ